MAKGDLIRAIMGMKHSPAGLKDLTSKRYAAAEAKAKPTKKKTMRTQRVEAGLKAAGLSDEQIRRMRGSKTE